MSLQKVPSLFLDLSQTAMERENGHSYTFGSFTLNLSERRLSDAGKPIPLTPKAFDVLAVLVQQAGHLVEKEELMSKVWPDSFVEESNVARIVHTLRKKLGDDGNGNSFIETVPTKGYRFISDVFVDETSSGNLNFSGNAWEPTFDQPNYDLDQQINRPWRSKNSIVTIAIAALVLAIFGSYFLFIRQGANVSADRRSIAVLPFMNSTGDEGQAYLADGITENIINNLSQLSGLKVIARNSVFPRYQIKDVDPVAAAHELNVDTLVMGDIKQLGNQLIINVNLIDPKDGSQLWGKQYQKNAFDVVATPIEISQAVAKTLNLKLNEVESRRLSSLPTEKGDAYQLYLKGQFYGQQVTPESLNKSIELYRQAIDKDPKFALAYSEIGMRYLNLGIYFMPPDETMPLARSFAQRALDIDNSLNDPHIVLGLVALMYDWNWEKAQDELAEGTSINLRSIEAFNCSAHVLQMAGRTSDADEALRRALQNDPLSKSLTTELGCNSYYARRFGESIDEYHEALTIDPRNFMAVYGLARSLNQAGKYQEAIDEINDGTSLMPHMPTIAIAERGYASAKSGHRVDAEKDLKTLDQLSRQFYVDPFFSAIIYLGMEDKEATLSSLEKAAAVRSSLMPSIVNDVKFDPMRSEPRFQELLHRIGFKGLDSGT